jgi:hypothetical protein
MRASDRWRKKRELTLQALHQANVERSRQELAEYTRRFGSREPVVPDGELRTRYVVQITGSFAEDLRTFRLNWAMADEAAYFDRVLGWLPRRIVPRRVNHEVIGDAIERCAILRERGASPWEMTLARFGSLFCIALEVIRYVVRAVVGRNVE